MRRILLVRHGQSQGNVDETKYKDPGDPLVELTDKGWQQAHDAGKFLRWYYAQCPASPASQESAPALWCSPYMRTRQTTQAVLQGLGWQDRPVREDIRLVEQSYGAAAWTPAHDHATAQHGLSREVFKTNCFLTPLPHGESLMDQFMRLDSFLGTLHREEARHGHDDALIICHGATIKNFLMRWFHLPDYQWRHLETPHNCDVIKLERGAGGWRAQKIYDGEQRHIALGAACKGGDPFSACQPLPIVPPSIKLN